MRIEVTEVLRIEEQGPLSLAELADLARLSESDVLELIDCGVIEAEASGGRQSFRAEFVLAARAASRLKEELELDAHGAAIALTLIQRIQDLEATVRGLLARGQTSV
jgi:chaperone modulatory protein CbpM